MKKKPTKKILKVLGIILTVLLSLLTFLSFAAYFSAKWYADVYGQMGFDSVLYTLFSDLNGTDSTLIQDFLKAVLPGTAVGTLLVCGFLFLRAKRHIALELFQKIRIRIFPIHRLIALICALVLSAGLLQRAAVLVELDEYIVAIRQISNVFEKEYTDPKTVSVTFPEKKRNLIYIFLESMEISYMSGEENGMLPYNTIPELYALAKDNVHFSPDGKMGGFYSVTGANWTIAAMTAHTAGIPLKTPPGIEGNDYGEGDSFLPGVTTLTDILHENGYYQALMFGSDASFGGRRQYYTQHKIDRIYDLFTARADGIVPEDYQVWWGMEDKHLFTYAKQELLEIAKQDQPFSFTMLTADTHHIGGYVCDLCENIYEEQYENVMACSSRQVGEFVTWLQQQDFYEDTTVVIVGDHPSMDNGYFQRNAPEDYQRMVYNCILNSAAELTEPAPRQFTALDLFPTTLAAMGCTIEGDRLGLGANLFSPVPTLVEKMGLEELDNQFKQNSAYYTNHFFFP